MRIKTITFQPYGCFNEKTVAFNEMLNVVYGPNEVGKTTLFNGIKTILYGFSPATRERNPYVNWATEQAKLSGKILVNGELFTIERRLMSAPKCYVKNEDTQTIQTLRNEPFIATHPISESMFASAFHLKAEDLESAMGRGWLEISQKLMHALEVPYLNPVREVLQSLDSDRTKLKRDDRRGNPEIPMLEKRIYQLDRDIKQCLEQEKQSLAKQVQLQNEKSSLLKSEALLSEINQKTKRYIALKDIYQWYEKSDTLQSYFDLDALDLLRQKEAVEGELSRLRARIEDLQNLKASHSKKDLEMLKTQLSVQYESFFKEKLDRERFTQVQAMDTTALWDLVQRDHFLRKWSSKGMALALSVGTLCLFSTFFISMWKGSLIAFSVICLMVSLYFLIQKRSVKSWKAEVAQRFKNRVEWLIRFEENPAFFVSRMELLKHTADQIYHWATPQHSEDERNLYHEMDRLQVQLQIVNSAITTLGEGDYKWGCVRLEQMQVKHKEWLTAKEMVNRLSEAKSLTDEDVLFMQTHSLDGLETQRMALEAECASGREKVMQLDDALKQLEVAERLATLYTSRDALQESLVACEQRYHVLTVSSALLSQAHRLYQDTHQPEILKKASDYFKTLTLGRYKAILLENIDETPCLYVETEQETLPFKDTFSKGTVQQLFLSLRLAFIDVMDPDKRLPLVIDEAMGVWDADRVQMGAALISEIAKERQVFVLTCHQHIANCFKEEHWIQL